MIRLSEEEVDDLIQYHEERSMQRVGAAFSPIKKTVAEQTTSALRELKQLRRGAKVSIPLEGTVD